jgi:hypothetical protein
MRNVLIKMIVFSLLWHILAVGIQVMAQSNVGVMAQYWMQYDFSISTNGEQYGGTIKMRISDVGINHILGTFEYKTNYPEFPNGNQTFKIHIPTWNGTDGFIIPSGLAEGQTITGLTPITTIQNVVDWRWRKAVKATAIVSDFYGEAYWDQETGVLLDMTFSMPGATGGISATVTNMFSMEGYTWLIRGIVIFVAIIVAILVVDLISSRRARALYVEKSPATSDPQQKPKHDFFFAIQRNLVCSVLPKRSPFVTSSNVHVSLIFS